MTAKLSRGGPDNTHERRKDLIPLLQKVQKTDGYLSPESVETISRKLKVSENEIYGVATFYAQFRFQPPGKYNIKVCLGTACHVGGGHNFMEVMKIDKNIGHGETTPDGTFSLERVACLGCCALAPVVVVNNEVHGKMNRVTFMKLLESLDPSRKVEEPPETSKSPE
ncbi:MAG: NAD(P)H-dependent oxidoreductase subunit E [Candidatus Aminicenantales bacterium]